MGSEQDSELNLGEDWEVIQTAPEFRVFRNRNTHDLIEERTVQIHSQKEKLELFENWNRRKRVLPYVVRVYGYSA